MVPENPTRCVGSSPPRPDGADKVTGRCEYVDDLSPPGLLHGATVWSTVASARILEVDASAALEEEGVTVLTAADLPGPNVVHVIEADWPVLADSRIDHVGQAVALVAAPTRAAARRAAEKVVVKTRELSAVFEFDEALGEDLEGEGELHQLAHCRVEHGDLHRALEGADHVVEGTYETGAQEHVYIEPQGVLALPSEGGAIEVIGSIQCPYYVHGALEQIFGEGKVRVRQAPTGGGFGGKEDYPDLLAAHATLLALATGKPVKLVYERSEDIRVTTKRHPSRVHLRAGVSADGKLLALEGDVLLDGGAFVTLSPVVLSRAVIHAAGPYRWESVSVRGRVLATNTPPNGAFRGFGAPQTQFAMERHMDLIARELGLDPLTLRELNAYRPGDVTPTGQVLTESVGAQACLAEAARRTDFRRRWQACEDGRRAAHLAGKPAPGIGLSLYWHGAGFTGSGEARMRSPVHLRLSQDGTIEIRVSSTDFGQGTEVALAQITADAVGVSLERVRFVNPDTREVPDSGPTVASRTIIIVGGLLKQAGETLSRQLCEFVAEVRGSSACHLEAGRFRGAEGRDVGGYDEHVGAFLAERGEVLIEERFEPDPEHSFDEETYRGTAYPAYGWGCDVVEVLVDPDTLAVRPTRVTIVADVGRVIHPTLCTGQLEGGTLQALGWGYLEELTRDRGHTLQDRFATYLVPTALDSPEMETVLLEEASPVGPYGAKGVGELPADGGAPALVAAIESATGIRSSRLPVTPERLLADLAAGRVVGDRSDVDDAFLGLASQRGNGS